MLEIKEWETEKLIPYARNPRKNDHAVPKMASLIKEFGFKVPVVIRSDGSVIDGHLRLKAAQHLGMKTVPVVLADDWTEAQVKAFRIAVNKSAELADWDNAMLRLELEELNGMDFDLRLTGFEPLELEDVLFPDAELDGGKGEDEAEEFKEYGDDIETSHKCPKCGYEW